MASLAPRPAWDVKARTLTRARVAVPLGLALLVLLSLVMRTRELDVGFWIDEGLSVGIADRPLLDIPGVLRQDGSPPLYYMLLSVWMDVFGSSESAVRALSLVFGTLCVPASWWAARVLFDTRAAWFAAVLAATSPYLTQYAQEGRMYALVALLAIPACACFGRAFLVDAPVAAARRRWAIGFAASLAALMYTHNWAVFLGLATGLTWLVLLARADAARRRTLLETGLIGFGGALLLYLPWVPTTLYQVTHTGAPWSHAPNIAALIGAPGRLVGVMAQGVLAVTAGAGIAALVGRPGERRGRLALALLGLGVATLVLAWLSSQLSPAWANRYLSIALAPFLLPVAAGLAHAGRLGAVGLLAAAVLGLADPAPDVKSNVREVAREVAPSLRHGDVVLVTQPEQLPVLHYYLPRGLTWTTLTGPVPDVGVTDWRDGVQRLEASTPAEDLQPILDGMAPGSRLVLATPIFFEPDRWTAPWTRAVRLKTQEWRQHLSNDPRFRVMTIEPPPPAEPVSNPVQAIVYVKTRARP
jgi:mannosyltransferase